MSTDKLQEKNRLHPRNRNRDRYDLDALIKLEPVLKNHIKPNKYGDNSLDFANPEAVRLLNKALLQHYYGVKNWTFPEENLCPPIPGRADYLLNAADLLAGSNFGEIPTGDKITCIDIGVGANCIYPILGVVEYGWHFLGTDIDESSIEIAKEIVSSNKALKGKIDFVLQDNPSSIFHGIIKKGDRFDLTVCNPPFHSSTNEAEKGSRRKTKNLSGKKEINPTLNFAGISNELICEGGESQFIHNMAGESKRYGKNCFWFTTLVSKQSNVKSICKELEDLNAVEIKTIPMGTGNKSTRLIAWTFLTKEEQRRWVKERWHNELNPNKTRSLK
jgi:23S rRNA (adenine1618-N6)-methyltransferase